MHLEANDLFLFARVANEGSFSRAAERIGLPKSTVSRRIAALEAQLGERLLLRTTRQLTLTDFGHSVLEHANQVAAEVEAAASLAQHRQVKPSGRLRVSMPADLANVAFGPMLATLVQQHPAIQLELDLSPRRVDLIGENFDLAIRIGELPDDATLAARQLAVFSNGLYASPGYLRQHGAPASPEDLVKHHALCLLPRSGEAQTWLLKQQERQIKIKPPILTAINSPELLIRLARHGAGIAAVADHYANAYVNNGELAPVLSDWSLPPVTAWAVFPGRRLMPARTRIFLEAIAAELKGPQCQAAQQHDRC